MDDVDDDFIEEPELVEADEPEDEDDDEINTDEPIHNTEHSTLEIIVPNEQRMTSQLLSLFEMTELINIRSRQISTTGISMIKSESDEAIKIAQQELMQRRCPLMLKRQRGRQKINGKLYNIFELWDPNKMTFPKQFMD